MGTSQLGTSEPVAPAGPAAASAATARVGRAGRRSRTVRILGTHGVPANYGGFETAAENVALHLVKRGWRAIVYCQVEGEGPIREDLWRGIERVIVPINTPGWLGTSKFDWITIKHACRFDDVCLTFGYNTAEDAGVKNPVCCSNINKIGFRMCGGMEAYERVLKERQFRSIAMSVFASGAIPPEEAIKWVCEQPNIESIVFGASSRGNIRSTKQLVDKYWREPVAA